MAEVSIESLRLHPDAEKVPMPSGDDLAALDASLRENGQEDPIDVTPDGVILDGRTRWTLLKRHGYADIKVRYIDCPADQQTGYIIDRALARRHLSMEQKQALNEVMASAVLETDTDPKTGEERRIGLGQSQRAQKLGVNRETVRNWDATPGVDAKYLASTPSPEPTPKPTHLRRSDGRVEPIRKERKADPEPTGRGHRGQKPVKHGRKKPAWVRDLYHWFKWSRPEEKALLLEIDKRVHAALAMNDIECDHWGGN
jgi:hypothetical protein